MRTVSSIVRMQQLAKLWRCSGIRIGFVPTMGFLHLGHVSLIERARSEVGSDGKVVVSVYVNPTQFGPKEDFAKYPRDLARDKRLCRDAGTDVLFVPSDREMYSRNPARPFSTYVVEENLSKRMEGESRPTHFRGVTTVVAKLFNIVAPSVVVFGAKDFQQAAIIQQMIRDLHFPIELIVAPTVREEDGLALSSRNKYLSPDQRREASVLARAIDTARKRIRTSKSGLPARELQTELIHLIHQQPSARVDYIEFFDPASFQPTSNIKRGVHMALAVFIGRTRLIDNARL